MTKIKEEFDDDLAEMLRGIDSRKSQDSRPEKKKGEVKQTRVQRVNKSGDTERLKTISLTLEQLSEIQELQKKFKAGSFMQIMKLITDIGIKTLESKDSNF